MIFKSLTPATLLGTEYRKTVLGASWPVQRLLKRRREKINNKENKEKKKERNVTKVIKAKNNVGLACMIVVETMRKDWILGIFCKWSPRDLLTN